MLENNSFSYKVAEFRHLGNIVKFTVQILVYCIIAIFFINVVTGASLIVYSIKNNTNELVTKKCVNLFQFILMIPFLLLYKIAFPANLHFFLKRLYDILIAKFESFEFMREQNVYIFDSYHNHPNFFDRTLNSNYLYNFGLIFCIHVGIISFYAVIVLLDNFFVNLHFYTRRTIKKIRNSLEYNSLIVFILLFQSQIIIFSTLNITSQNLNTSFSVFSFILSIVYLKSFTALAVIFAYFYMKEHRFYHQSQIKFQISYLFIGY